MNNGKWELMEQWEELTMYNEKWVMGNLAFCLFFFIFAWCIMAYCMATDLI
jgi:hypothetical protein